MFHCYLLDGKKKSAGSKSKNIFCIVKQWHEILVYNVQTTYVIYFCAISLDSVPLSVWLQTEDFLNFQSVRFVVRPFLLSLTTPFSWQYPLTSTNQVAHFITHFFNSRNSYMNHISLDHMLATHLTRELHNSVPIIVKFTLNIMDHIDDKFNVFTMRT